MEPRSGDQRDDELIWGPDPRGKFTLKSAYELVDRSTDNPTCDLWKIVWKWEGPCRVKNFLWLVAHNRILTNVERHRRHMADETRCVRCPDAPEDSLHVLRDFHMARELWMSLIPNIQVGTLFTVDAQTWMCTGLLDHHSCLQFGIVICMLWKARNEAVFENKFVTCDQLRLPVLYWIIGVRETMKVDSQTFLDLVVTRVEGLIS
ncbi:Putative ribonuclease H protein At1g65750 [Linum perenne]